jgi:two-component system cell cycle sensor histidine kinase/response regulator CckA
MLIPANPGAAGRDSRPASLGPRDAQLPRGTETILLVEDDDSVRFFTCRLLEIHGYTVLEARNGKEAMEVAAMATGPIDMLLSDAIMPLMVGGELARSLRVVRPQLKVLFMSGFTDDEVVRRGMLDGDSVLLEKPFTVEDITRRVRDVLDGRLVRSTRLLGAGYD